MKNKCLSDEQVVDVLTSTASSAELARRFEMNASSIRSIRNGRYYKNVRPDLPRIKSSDVKPEPRFCCDCIHHIGKHCSMGFPEQKRSAKVAEVCNFYAEKEINPCWRDVVIVEATS